MSDDGRPRVLVTGAAGYLGRLTVEALAKRRDELDALVALDVRETREGNRQEGVEFVVGDICSDELGDLLHQHRIDTVVHLVAIVRAPKGAPPDFAYRVEVEGTENLLRACLAAGAKRLIVTSSGAAYGYHADNPEWLDERDPLRGNDDFAYSRHKRLIEEMLARWREEHPEIEQLVFRPCTVLGTTVKSPISDLFEMRAMVGIAGSPSPFVFIWDQDVVACLLEGVFGSTTGIYNLAGDGVVTPHEIARRLHKPYVPLPAGLVKVTLRVLRALGVTEHGPERVKFLRYRPVLSNRRLKTEFGYEPELSSLEAFDLYARSRGLIV